MLGKIFGGRQEREIKRLKPIVGEINTLEKEYEALSLGALREKTLALKVKYQKSEKSTGLLPEMFALTREAAKRTLHQRHFDVQLLGGMALHEGNIVEMRTGEGKTLAATLAVSLEALAGKGAHVVTVNDYLARRDTVWMGQIYHALGLSVGCITHDASYLYDPEHKQGQMLDEERDILGSFKIVEEFLKPCSRREAYAADITYGTNNEFGFDWLRDNLEVDKTSLRQRGHNFVIIDEVDSILIDEARTPLIISAPDAESEDLYQAFSRVVPQLRENEHYNIDEKLKAATLTEEGISKVEKLLGVSDIYTERGIRYVHHLEQALRANTLFHRDRDYVVKNGEIIIVDEFTGRLMPGRRWSEGLHQAIEAKESVRVEKESRTLASVTFQNYFRMYTKIAGMTGTALTSEEEFHKVYNLNVVVIPTHKQMIREDLPDRIYQSEEGKWKAVLREIASRHEKGQPVLVGTVSIEKNEKLSGLLKKEGIRHEVLNAKNHEREAEIIADAGKYGAVTIATNMAGRGVDIVLGGISQDEPFDPAQGRRVRELGGLFVLGTERHEARRIDNQLRGRAGRQGDPGASQFFVSLEDSLMRVFGSERIKRLMGTFGIPEDEPIESRMVSKSLEAAQSKIEGFHFDARKHILDYDDVMSRQRNAIYKSRRDMLFAGPEEIEGRVRVILGTVAKNITETHASGNEYAWRREEIAEILHSITGEHDIHKTLSEIHDREVLGQKVESILFDALAKRAKEIGDSFFESGRMLYLEIIDYLWRDHLEVMEYTRSSVRLRAYGQHDPLVEYKNEASRLFKTFNNNLESLFVQNMFKLGAQPLSPKTQKYQETKTGVIPPQGRDAQFGNSPEGGRIGKVGRNDPCPCGSGKKYKRCHGA